MQSVLLSKAKKTIFRSYTNFILMQAESIHWAALARAIERQRVLLFIGPKLTLNYPQAGRQSETDFLQGLAEESGGAMRYVAEEGFVVFKDRRARVLRMPDIEDFYKRDFSHPLLEKLLEIPFHIIISAGQDLSIDKLFLRKNYAFHSQYYQRSRSKGRQHSLLDEKPSAQKPLVYQLFGSAKDPENLLLTHKDFFEYMRSLYSHESLPVELLEAFSEERSDFALFLGFDFTKWYYQFVLHVLDLEQLAGSYATSEQSLAPPYDESHFRIQVLPEDMELFIDTLHAQFAPENLRQPSLEANKRERKYFDKHIFKLMNSSFIQGELETFCMLNFEEVYDDFSPNQSRSARLTLLFEYVKNKGQFDMLLELIHEENPYQFEKHAPYYEEL